MGCWNGTCGLSQLPIHAGDHVIGFLLEGQGAKNAHGMGHIGSGGYCYSTDLFAPLFVPMLGRYDDYGAIMDIKGAKILVDFFNKEKTIKLNPEHETDAAPKKPRTVKDLVNYVERGQYTFNWNPEFGNEGFGLIMFHRGIYERVVATIGERKPYDQKESYKTLLGRRIAAKVDKRLKVKDPLMRLQCNEWLRLVFNIDRGAFYNTELLDMAFAQVDAGRMTPEGLTDLLTEFDLICRAMEFMRKLWIPQAGAGSQSTEYKLHTAMHEAAQKVMQDWLDEDESEDFDPSEETIHWWDKE